jgi:uncharacterized membrane protein YphA (DoxX/SURF4 family)
MLAINRISLLVGRIVLAAIFLYSAYSKLRNPWMLFAMSVDSYKMLPEWAVEVAARGIPWLELALGALLVLGWKLRWIAAGASALLLAFFGAMLRAYSHGLQIDCGCFGPGEKLGAGRFVIEGLFLALAMAVSLRAFFARRTEMAPANCPTRIRYPPSAK